MAKQRQVDICIYRDNISQNALIKSLQKMHIEALKEIVKNMECTESQAEDLLTEMQKADGMGGQVCE